MEVDLEETDNEGRLLHQDVIIDRVLRREHADQRVYKRILKSCHSSLQNSALNTRHLKSLERLQNKQNMMFGGRT